MTKHRTRYNPNTMKSEYYCLKCDTVHKVVVKPNDPQETMLECKTCKKGK